MSVQVSGCHHLPVAWFLPTTNQSSSTTIGVSACSNSDWTVSRSPLSSVWNVIPTSSSNTAIAPRHQGVRGSCARPRVNSGYTASPRNTTATNRLACWLSAWIASPNPAELSRASAKPIAPKAAISNRHKVTPSNTRMGRRVEDGGIRCGCAVADEELNPVHPSTVRQQGSNKSYRPTALRIPGCRYHHEAVISTVADSPCRSPSASAAEPPLTATVGHADESE